jgi:uncharacterized protein (DUF302 family)
MLFDMIGNDGNHLRTQVILLHSVAGKNQTYGIMKYYFNKVLKHKSFDQAIAQVTAALKTEGFGVLTEIDVKATLKQKIDVDFRQYRILGACNPHFAYQALQSENKIGAFLPCNIVVQEHENGDIEVSSVDPVSSMSSVDNAALEGIATEVQQKLKNVIESLD